MLQRKNRLVLAAIFVLLVVGSFQHGMFWGGQWLGATGEEQLKYKRELEAIQDLQLLAGPMAEESELLRSQLRQRTGPYVTSPDDAFGWASAQISYLAHQLGIQIDRTTEVGSDRIPSRRNEAARIFEPYRVRADFQANLEKALRLVNELQARNPYVVVAEFSVGPRQNEQFDRRVSILVEWPRWSDGELLHLVVEENQSGPEKEFLR
jgi:hypothetical protein